MATRDFADIDAALAELFMDRIANQINRAVVLAQILPVKPGTGKNVQWAVRTGTATPSTAVIADGADVTTFNTDDKDPAVLQFGTYHDAFAITGKAMAGAGAAGNPAELAALLTDDLGDSVERLARAMAADVYTGSGAANTIHGLFASGAPAIGDTGVYAGINRASVTQFQGNVVDALAGPLTIDLMRELRRDIYTASGQKPDIWITDPRQHEVYGTTFGQERRYVDQIRNNLGQVIRLDGGYQVLEFDGVAVIEDEQHPALTMTALNTMHVGLSQLYDSPDALNRAMGIIKLKGTPEEQYGDSPIPLTARLQPLAITGDAFKFALYCYPQLCVKRPNANGFIENLQA